MPKQKEAPEIVEGPDNDEATTHTNQMGEIVRTTQKSPPGLVVPSFHKSQTGDAAEPDDYELVRVAGLGPTAEIPVDEFEDRLEQAHEEGEHELEKPEVAGVDLDEDEDEDEDYTERTPAAEKLASEHGVDLDDVEGTGKDGRVTQADVEKHLDGDE